MQLLKELGINIDDNINILQKFVSIFREYNQKVNLISKNDEKYIFEKHIYDSLAINLFIQKYYKNKMIKVIDIGTGGGFPSIPTAICLKNTDVTAVDSTLKKIKFIEYIKNELALKNLHTICKRAELLDFKPEFDLAVSRAMAELRVILEYTLPYIKKDSYFVAYKSLKAEQEIKDSKNALKILRAEIVEQIEYKLPLAEQNKRVLLVIRKNDKTDSLYPRKNGIIEKKPL